MTHANARALSERNPRNAFARDTYEAAELKALPARPHSQAATEIPSRVGQRLVYRDGRQTDLQGQPIAAPAHRPAERVTVTPAPATLTAAPAAPTPTAPPAPEQPMAIPYVPRAGSLPDRVIAALQAAEEHAKNSYLTLDEIAARFGMVRNSWHSIFRRPLDTGVLVQVHVDGLPALALPTWDPYKPPAQLADAKAPPAPAPVAPDNVARLESAMDALTRPITPAPRTTGLFGGSIGGAFSAATSAASLQSQLQGCSDSTAAPAVRPGFKAARWSDGTIELRGVQVDAMGCAYLNAAESNALVDLLGSLPGCPF